MTVELWDLVIALHTIQDGSTKMNHFEAADVLQLASSVEGTAKAATQLPDIPLLQTAASESRALLKSRVHALPPEGIKPKFSKKLRELQDARERHVGINKKARQRTIEMITEVRKRALNGREPLKDQKIIIMLVGWPATSGAQAEVQPAYTKYLSTLGGAAPP